MAGVEWDSYMGVRHLSEIELTEYADGETEAGRLAEVEGHLRACGECARAAARMREAAVRAGGMSAVAAPAGLRKRVAETLIRELGGVSCREAGPLLHGYLDDSLAPGAALLLSHHLDSCSTCRAELAVLTSAARLVRALPDVSVPDRVRESVLAEGRRRRRAPGRPSWRPVLAGAVAALAAAVMLFRHAPEAGKGQVIAQAGRSQGAGPAAIEIARPAPESDIQIAPEPVEMPAQEPAIELAEARPEPAQVRPTVLIQPAGRAPKGPSTAPVVMETSPPQVAMPAGLRALRAVVRSASDVQAPPAMQLAGERYATLRSEALSEAMLVRPATAEPARDERDAGEKGSLPALAQPESPASAPSASPQPAREGATLLGRPLA
jgi:anti-sigma factor RsiW